SSSSPGSAAQLTLRNCLPARGEALWIARARTSLPVPLSPRSSTVVFVLATFVTRSRIGCILLLVQRAIRGSLIGDSLLRWYRLHNSPSVCSNLHWMCQGFTHMNFQ